MRLQGCYINILAAHFLEAERGSCFARLRRFLYCDKMKRTLVWNEQASVGQRQSMGIV